MIQIKMVIVNNIDFEQNLNRQLMLLQAKGGEIIDIHFELHNANSIAIITYKDNGGEL